MKKDNDIPLSPSAYIKSHNTFSTFNSHDFLKLLNCSTKENARSETLRLIDDMLSFQNLNRNVESFIEQLRDLTFLSDINAERYWTSVGVAANVQKQINLYNVGMSSSLDSAKEFLTGNNPSETRPTKRKHVEIGDDEKNTFVGEVVLPRRESIPVDHDGFVNSNIIIKGENSDSPSSSISSSYLPSDLSVEITGYKCELTQCELMKNDIPKSVTPIADESLASLIADAEELVALNQLFPLDIERRLHVSGIFSSVFISSKTTQEETIVELPAIIYRNILSLKRAIQQNTLYIQPHPSTTLEESCLNTILLTTYTFHGKPLIKSKFSELHLIANSISLFITPFFCAHNIVQIEWDATSWVYKQLDDRPDDTMRPDILLHVKSGDTIIEIGCGEVKKSDIGRIEAKARVLETMKRQMHLKMKFGKKIYEIETFGILIIGTEITLIKMYMDMTKWVYIYEESAPFILPTTYETYGNMDIAMEIMTGFKKQMLKSIRKPEDYDCNDNVWQLYKSHIRPTASSFKPIHETCL